MMSVKPNSQVKRRSNHPPATVYVEAMRPLTGRTVVIRGHKADGTEYVRTLANCSYVPGRGRGEHRVEGLDVSVGQVRSFRLAQVRTLRLRLGGPEFSGMDLVATMDAALRSGPAIEERVWIEEAA